MKKCVSNKPLAVFFLLFIFIILPVLQAQAWWNEKWSYRKRIVIDTNLANEDLDSAVVLIRLHSGNFDFSKPKEDGSDLRFVDSYDKTPLYYHLEKYDFLDEIALVWVKITKASCNPAENSIWMYYGNGNAGAGEEVHKTYDENYAAVFHFRESSGLPQEQTESGNHMSEFSGGQGLPALIGNGVFLNGIGDKMVVPGSPSMRFSSGFTLSAWIKISGIQRDSYIFSREEGTNGIIFGIDQTRIYALISTEKDRMIVRDTNMDLVPNTWHHITFSINEMNKLTMYLDGTEQYAQELTVDLPHMETDIYIGASAAGGHGFSGDMDELQISNIARAEPWVQLAAKTQGPEEQILAFGSEEQYSGGGALGQIFFQYYQYTRTIVKNLTLDGGLIIGILIFMFILSEIILMGKYFSLWLMERENKAFLHSFRNASHLLSFKKDTTDLQHSSIYRVYCEGIQELKRHLGNPHPKTNISQKAINSFKTVLEKASTHEEQQMNRWLLILTFAISGAPFLGLLGTVWGVMNTFAAMAAAGEADIVVIAPGIASALATTVVGLIVAIPALFGYNFIVGKIKNITADIYFFVDDLTCKADETYGDQS